MDPRPRLPQHVRSLWLRLDRAAPTYLVGGCLRDALLGAPPKDFDLATVLRPEQVEATARAAGLRTLPTGLRFGTVTVLAPEPVEVTTLRADGRYSDRRHPDEVRFSERIEDDLARRDFTVNAMALPYEGDPVDPFGGRADLGARLIRTVGDPADRFLEDPLRMWRAVRFLSQLNDLAAAGAPWRLDPDTYAAIVRHRAETCALSRERVRDELLRTLGCRSPEGLQAAIRSRLAYIAVPELAALEGFAQHHPQHDTDVLEHTMKVVEGVEPRTALRLAALLHDIAKPQCVLRMDGVTHFYGHDELGADMAGEILRRLRAPADLTEHVVRLVAHHMFPWRQAGAKGYRRLLAALGSAERLQDLFALHVADVRGSRAALAGWTPPDEFGERIAQVLAETRAPDGGRLAVDGHDLMAAFGLTPGPAVGALLREAQDWVWEDPSRNTRERILEHLDAAGGGPAPED